MQIIRGLDFNIKNSSVTLGKFDGIHRGHRLLLREICKKGQYIPTVFTFEMNQKYSKIYTQEEKNQILESLGIEREIIFPFTEETKNMSAQEFIEEILVKKMDVKYICVGNDYHFGRNREGNIETLRQFQKKYHYELDTVSKVTYNDEIVSSTLIRQTMEEGNLSKVNKLLEQDFFVLGEVIHGNALGRTINMPTANLVAENEKKLLPYGVYATTAIVDGKEHYSVTNIGTKPTIGKYQVGIETYIDHFDQDIYGKKIKVIFHKFLRPEKKFENVHDLKIQIENDKSNAIEYLQKRINIDSI